MKKLFLGVDMEMILEIESDLAACRDPERYKRLLSNAKVIKLGKEIFGDVPAISTK